MRFIPTRVHGVLDYLVGILLIAAPWLLGFADNTAQTYVPVALGIMALVYSLCTNYELGAYKGISMKTHLTLDFLSGAFLAASPWLFNFDDRVYMPHLILGIFEMGAALMTHLNPGPADNRLTGHHRQHAH